MSACFSIRFLTMSSSGMESRPCRNSNPRETPPDQQSQIDSHRRGRCNRINFGAPRFDSIVSTSASAIRPSVMFLFHAGCEMSLVAAWTMESVSN